MTAAAAQVQGFTVAGKAAFTAHLPLPSRACSQNARVHWAVRSKAVRHARRHATYAFRAAMPKGWVVAPVRLHVTYRMKPGAKGDRAYRPRDTQNAIGALKAAIDGMVDAGVVPDDSAKWVSWGEVWISPVRPGDTQGEGVYVTVVAQAAARATGDEGREGEHGDERTEAAVDR